VTILLLGVREIICGNLVPMSADLRHYRSWSSAICRCPSTDCTTCSSQHVWFSCLRFYVGPTVWNSLPKYSRDPTLGHDQFRSWWLICSVFDVSALVVTLLHPLVTVLHPQAQSSLKITNRSFRYAAPHLWNKLPPSLRVIVRANAFVILLNAFGT